MVLSLADFYRRTALSLWGAHMLAKIQRNLTSAYKHGRKVQWRQFSTILRRALWACGWDVFARPIGRKYQLIFRPIGPDEQIGSPDWEAHPIITD